MKISDLAGKVVIHSQKAQLGGVEKVDKGLNTYKLKMNGTYSWLTPDQVACFSGNLLTAHTMAGKVQLHAFLPFSKPAFYAQDLKETLERAVNVIATLDGDESVAQRREADQVVKLATNLLEQCK